MAVNDYELLYIVHPRLAANEVQETVERVSGIVTSAGGEVLQAKTWGRRRLAYTIDHQLEGTYVLKHLRLDPAQCRRLEYELRVSDDVMRHLLLKGIGEFEIDTRERRDERVREASERSAEATEAQSRAEPATGSQPEQAEARVESGESAAPQSEASQDEEPAAPEGAAEAASDAGSDAEEPAQT